jgi:hypothetical protein
MRILPGALVICALLLPVLAGCEGGASGDLPELVPVSGTVTLDGEPESGVQVTFVPTGSTKGGSSYGATDESGKYELTADDGRKGAAVGEFQVMCNKWVMPDGSDFVGEPGGPSPMEAGASELLPPRYSREDATELTATVPAGGGTVDFDLTSGQ